MSYLNDDALRPLHGLVTFMRLSKLMYLPRYSGIEFIEGRGWRLLRQPKPGAKRIHRDRRFSPKWADHA